MWQLHWPGSFLLAVGTRARPQDPGLLGLMNIEVGQPAAKGTHPAQCASVNAYMYVPA